MAGIDVVFHQAAIRITQCAEEPRLGARRAWSTARSTCSRPRSSAGVRQGRRSRRRRRSTAWPSTFPTTERHHPYDNRHVLRRGQGVQRGRCCRTFHEMYGLDYVALRYFNVYGPRMDDPRRLHRGARPLDGAHRRRRAAADPRRRLADDGLRLRRRRRPGEPARRRSAGRPTRSSTSAAATETSLLELAAGAPRVMGTRPRARVRPGAGGQPGAAAARRHVDGRASSSASSRGRARGRPARLVELVASRAVPPTPSSRRRADDDDRGDRRRRRRPIPVMQPALGDEEAQAAAEAVRVGLGRPGPAGRRVRGGVRGRASAPRTASPCRRARPRCTSRSCSLGVGPGDEVIVPSLSFIATANVVRYVGATPVFADVDPPTPDLTRETRRSRAHPDARKAVIVVHQCGVPGRPRRASTSCATRSASRVVEDAACAIGLDVPTAQPIGAALRARRVLVPPAQGHHHGRGRDAHHRRRGVGGAAAPAARARHERQRRRAPRQRQARSLEQYLEVGFNYRMTDIQAAVGLVQLGRLDEIVARRRELGARYQELLGRRPRARDDRATRRTARRTSSRSGCCCPTSFPVSRDELLGAAARGRRSPRGAGSWPRTSSPRTPGIRARPCRSRTS